ncbi:MAG: hypothetical protein KBT35_05845 [Firmicutes bacterium]|nr:hypothetical protein [Candidatus Colivicinus equi]
MANLTKAEREKREAEKEAKIRAEIEEKLRAEFEEKLKAETQKATTSCEDENKEEKETASNARRIQKSVRIPLDTIVPVVCNTVGGAIYISKKIVGYQVEWDDIGSIEYMELGELASMRNTDRRFFEDNWVVLEDTDEYTSSQLYDFLKVAKYYENALTPEMIDDLLAEDKQTVTRKCSSLSNGMKKAVAVRAKQKLDAGTLDKNLIDVLEEILEMQLTL